MFKRKHILLSWKNLMSVTLVFLTLVLFQHNIYTAEKQGPLRIVINGQEINLDTKPRLENGRILVPFRAIFESMGGKVRWIKTKKMVVAQYGILDLRFQVGESTARLANQNIKLDVPAKIVQGRTLVPLRFISESLFTAKVSWNGSKQTVTIEYPLEVDQGDLSFALQKRVQQKTIGEFVDLRGLEIMRIPEITPERYPTPGSSATLLFSDSPEYVDQPGITYQGNAKGDIRLAYYHINRLDRPVRMGLIAHNPGNKSAVVTIKEQVNGDLENNRRLWQDLGAAVTLKYLNKMININTVSNSVSNTQIIGPGSSVLLNLDNAPYQKGELMHGIADLFVDQELKFSFVVIPDEEMSEASLKALGPVLPPDGRHDRGTFTGADQLMKISFSNKLEGFMIGDGFSDLPLSGVDQANGNKVTLLGNYGVTYQLNLSFDYPTAVLLIPLGGDYFSGGIATPQGVLSLDKVPTFSQGLFLGQYKKGDKVQWTFMPPGGSNLPVLIMCIPI